MRLRHAKITDIPSIAELHFKAGKKQLGGFMYKLGYRFLNLYYKIEFDESNSIILVAEDTNGSIYGFISGTLAAEEHIHALRKNWLKLTISVLPIIIRSPAILIELVNRFGFLFLKTNKDQFIVSDGPRVNYWIWDIEKKKNLSFFLFKRWLDIVFSQGVSSIKGEIDMQNAKLFNIHKRLGAQIIKRVRLSDGRIRLIIEFHNQYYEHNTFVKNMHILDLEQVVRIHMLAFPNFFLTELGKDFIHELYKNFIINNSSICKVAICGAEIKGFVIGNLVPERLFRILLLKNGHKFLFFTMKAMIRNPKVVVLKLLYAIKYRGEPPKNFKKPALLSSIGVHPKMEAKGIGKQLINTFCNEAFNLGADCVYLTTDKYSNDRINAFYLKNGFVFDSIIKQPNNRYMNRYIKLKCNNT